MILTLDSRSESTTRAIAAQLASTLSPGDLLTLRGPLGAGKTAFVRGLAEGLGIEPSEVSSPTFALCHEYGPPAGNPTGIPLAHLDGYRIAAVEELESIGWFSLLDEARQVIAVEWPERFGEALPVQRIDLTIDVLSAQDRRLTLHVPDHLAENLRNMLAQFNAENIEPCPICTTPASREADSFPFCSARCRNVDLGRWLNERYQVSRPIEGEDLLED